MVYANDKPDVRGRDEGIWRRFRLAPFTAHFDTEAKDPELPEKLRDELPGILSWALDGCLAWQAARALREPKAVVRATAGYQTETDELAEFLFDKCRIRTASDTDDAKADQVYRTTRSDLRDAYRRWCEENDQRAWSNRAFVKALKERGFEETRIRTDKGPRRGWKGLRLLEEWESPVVTYDGDLPLTHARVGESSSESGDYSDYTTTPGAPSEGEPVVTNEELAALPGWARMPSDTEREDHIRWRERIVALRRESPLRDLPSCGLQARKELLAVLTGNRQEAFHDDW